jgi:hypothetical protein
MRRWPDVPSLGSGFSTMGLAEHIARTTVSEQPGQSDLAGLFRHGFRGGGFS